MGRCATNYLGFFTFFFSIIVCVCVSDTDGLLSWMIADFLFPAHLTDKAKLATVFGHLILACIWNYPNY